MSDPIEIQILREVHNLRQEVAEVRAALLLKVRVVPLRDEEARRALVLMRWHHLALGRPIPTREVVALGLEGAPSGTLRAVALELETWTGEIYRALGTSDGYRLRRCNRHGLAHWSVERIS